MRSGKKKGRRILSPVERKFDLLGVLRKSIGKSAQRSEFVPDAEFVLKCLHAMLGESRRGMMLTGARIVNAQHGIISMRLREHHLDGSHHTTHWDRHFEEFLPEWMRGLKLKVRVAYREEEAEAA